MAVVRDESLVRRASPGALSEARAVFRSWAEFFAAEDSLEDGEAVSIAFGGQTRWMGTVVNGILNNDPYRAVNFDFADLEDGVDGVDVVVGGAGYSRDGNNHPVLRASAATAPYVEIGFPSIAPRPMLYATIIEYDLSVANPSAPGGSTTPWDNTRWGWSYAVEGADPADRVVMAASRLSIYYYVAFWNLLSGTEVKLTMSGPKVSAATECMYAAIRPEISGGNRIPLLEITRSDGIDDPRHYGYVISGTLDVFDFAATWPPMITPYFFVGQESGLGDDVSVTLKSIRFMFWPGVYAA